VCVCVCWQINIEYISTQIMKYNQQNDIIWKVSVLDTILAVISATAYYRFLGSTP